MTWLVARHSLAIVSEASSNAGAGSAAVFARIGVSKASAEADKLGYCCLRPCITVARNNAGNIGMQRAAFADAGGKGGPG